MEVRVGEEEEGDFEGGVRGREAGTRGGEEGGAGEERVVGDFVEDGDWRGKGVRG